MKFILILLWMLPAFVCHAQQNDSLLFQLTHIADDTERVNQIYKAGFEIRNTNPELAYQYALACETAAGTINSSKHKAKSYNLIGILCYKKGDYTKALLFQKKALALNEAIHYSYGIAINETNLGNIYSDIGNYALAEVSYLKALRAYNDLNNNEQIAKCLINLGVLKFTLKQYDPAVKQFQEALAIANTLNDLDLMATCHNNIGAIFMVQDKLDSSIVYLEEGLKLLNLRENEMEMADVYNNMANVYIKQQHFSEAKTYLNLADSLCNAYDYTEAKVELYQTYSFFFEAQQDYKSANDWLKKHYHLKDSILQLNKATSPSFTNDEISATKPVSEKQVFKNEWILVILGALTVVISLFLMKYKR
ncbi:MAG: tetratricopeptide repeat protein [Bacteroidota bacterium]